MTEFKKILESTVLSEENKEAMLEAWDSKIAEAREEIATELREEFASRYEHDKGLVIEASEKFLRDSLAEELKEFEEDKKKVREARIELARLKEGFASKASAMIAESLRKELSEFRTERKQVNESIMAMQSFVREQLTEEVAEFAADKKSLVEARVEFERKKDKELKEVKAQFVESATKVTEKLVKESLRSEMEQLKTDLKESKDRMFGAKLFEAFASEFMASHYNEGSQLKKMSKVLENAKSEIKSLTESLQSKDKMIAEAKSQATKATELKERAEIMNKILSPLNKSQRTVMKTLLESTKTAELEKGYKKFLGAVLNENSEVLSGDKEILTESKSKVAYDGNRQAPSGVTEDDTIVRLQKLSGIK